MMVRIFFLIAILVSIDTAWAQWPVADFTGPAQVCSGEAFELQNQSVNAVRYEWDFCQGDLQLTPTASRIANLASLGANIVVGVDFIQYNGNWYGFFTSFGNNSIFRVDFGADLNNASPQVTNLGTFGGVLLQPQAIELARDGNNVYAFVSNDGGNKLVRLSFGNSPTTNPAAVTADVLLTGGADLNTGLDVAFDGTDWVVVVSNDFNLTLVNLHNSLANTPTVSDILTTGTVSGSWILSDIELIYNGQWYGLATSYNNAKLLKLTFGASLFSTPIASEVAGSGIPAGSNPSDVAIVYENNMYQALISTLQGSLIRCTFGDDLANTASGTNLGTLGLLQNNLKIKVVRDKSRYFGFSQNWNTSEVYRLNFPQVCSGNTAFSTATTPKDVQYTSSGVKTVTLYVYNATGQESSKAVTLTVRPEAAPSADFSAVGVCENHNTQFTPVDQTLTYDWDFGDSQTSVSTNPVHIYAAAAVYPVTLVVEKADGCKNRLTKPITIYNFPAANFTIPAPAVTCTGQQYTFINTTSFDVPSNPTWNWEVDNVSASTAEDAQLTFQAATAHQVKLTASIPGCSSVITKTFNVQSVGPAVGFDVVGRCQNTPVQFTNTTSGPVTGYAWNFGDGQISVAANPTNTFANSGTFNVSLTAFNASGCDNTASVQLTVYSAPQVNFMALAPPFSCSGTATQFNDLTPPPLDSNLGAWLWDFGDTGPANMSAQRNAQHTYSVAGDYSVSLTVTSNFLCSTTLQKTITIYQTPAVAFTNTPLCEDLDVIFSDATANHIAWNWQIGSNFYTTENPTHVFANPGTFNVTLAATAANNCIGTASQSVTIKPKINVDFSAAKTCVNQQTLFTDLIDDTTDPITGVNWNFGGLGTATSSPATFRFLNTGTASVTLTATTTSGCAYPVTKAVTITSGPLAAFTAEPNLGEAPMVVGFTNTSLNAATFRWNFGDEAGSTSTISSPAFTFTKAGGYIVTLVATDVNNCVDSTRQFIEVEALSELNPPSPNPGTGKFAIEWDSGQAAKTVIAVMDGTGRQMREFEVMSRAGRNRYTLDISGEQPGLYILTIRYLNSVRTYRLMLAE